MLFEIISRNIFERSLHLTNSLIVHLHGTLKRIHIDVRSVIWVKNTLFQGKKTCVFQRRHQKSVSEFCAHNFGKVINFLLKVYNFLDLSHSCLGLFQGVFRFLLGLALHKSIYSLGQGSFQQTFLVLKLGHLWNHLFWLILCGWNIWNAILQSTF